MVWQGAWRQTFEFLGSKPVVVEPVECQLSSDAGLLPIREFDEAIGFTQQFADVLNDPRDQTFTRHSFAEMTRSRIYGILADYEDQNDHDVLRSDPVFKLIAGRSPDAGDLASQPTLSRFENAISVRSLFRLRDVMIDQFIASFDTPPARLTFDIDTYDDAAHGEQQLVLFHGYYNQYQYQPRLITCADNDTIVMVCLLYGSASPALGAEDDLEYLTQRLRAVWPDVDIEVRADSGFGVPHVFDACEELRIWYSIGEKMNRVLQRDSAACLAEAVAACEAGEGAQRLFTSFWYRAGSWDAPRFTIVKCEANAQGTNRRAIVSNRPGAAILPAATYDEYADRGESENRNKELKRGLAGDRLSDHRYMANLFRLYLHTAAHNLLVRLRRAIAHPPTPSPVAAIPTEALSDPDRKRYETRRRERDPLGEGHPCTWRSRLIKVAAQVVVTTRRIRVLLSGCWPYLHFYRDVSQAIQSCHRPDPAPD
jgi:Transposase DDE domain group 1